MDKIEERADKVEKKSGKAAENKRLKRNALLSTAFELFTEQGIAGTSISDIVEKAGVAKGTFYLYFKDKYDLRDRLIRHKASQILEAGFEALDGEGIQNLEDKIVYLSGNIMDQLSNDKVLLRFIAKNLSWGMLKYEFSNKSSTASESGGFVERMEDAFAQSDVKYENPELMVYMIVELIGASCYSSILESDPAPFEKLRPYILRSIRAIIKDQEIKEADVNESR